MATEGSEIKEEQLPHEEGGDDEVCIYNTQTMLGEAVEQNRFHNHALQSKINS